MADIEGSDSGESQDRAHLLIGRFMDDWSDLEFALNWAVWRLLEMNHLVIASALTVNMGVRDKINLVGTCLNFGLRNAPDLQREAAKLMEKIGDRAGDRNIAAHTSFTSHPRGVEFRQIKAKGRFDAPSLVWTEDDFDQKAIAMADLAERLAPLTTEALKHRTPMPIDFDGPQESPKPREEARALGFWDFLLNPHLEDPGSR